MGGLDGLGCGIRKACERIDYVEIIRPKLPLFLGQNPAMFCAEYVSSSLAPCLGKQLDLPFVLFGWKLNPSHQSRSSEQYRAQAASESTSL